MPDSPQRTTVSASLTQAILHAAQQLGLLRTDLLSVCQLSESQLADPDNRIPFSNQELLWQHLQQQLAQPEPGLAIGLQLAPGPFSVLGYLLQSSRTLDEALEAVQRYQRLVGEGGAVHLHERNGVLHLSYQPLHAEHSANRPRILALMASWVQWMRPLLEGFQLLEVRLMHAAPADLTPYQHCFACPLQFDAEEYALLLPAEQRQAALKQANPTLQTLLRQHAEQLLAQLPSASLSARVVSLISGQLAQGEPNRTHLAKALLLSERTMQRRLAEEGQSYQQLLSDTRQHLAERHLAEGRLPATEIALLLGYSEPSVFFRAFRQWTGLTPGEYRSQHPQTPH